MKTQRLIVIALVPFVWLAPLAGCGASSIAKQTFYEIRGAKSKIIPVTDPSQDALLEYRAVNFEPVVSTLGENICPPKLLRYYDEYLREVSDTLREVYPGGAPGLRVSSEILYFQRKGLFSGAECLARVKMRDVDTEHLVVDAIVRSESKSFRAGGESALAESGAQAVAKFLRKRGLEDDDDNSDD